jgi:molecular chaperone GrpE
MADETREPDAGAPVGAAVGTEPTAAPEAPAPADGGEAPAAGGETAPAAVAALADPAVAELKRQRDEYYDRFLRKAAELDNYRKRVERERRELEELAAADLIRELLPLVDDLERALAAEVTAEAVGAYRQGIELIYRQLLDVLRRRGVTPIEAVGRDFDPRYHQAVIHEPSDTHRDGEVIAELRRGYRLGDRLLRPALVKVAKA